jgi:tetratricopeptide (TPR) repeat protein
MQDRNELDAQTLGQVIRERRGERSREELAARLEIDEKTLLAWEQGRVTRIHLANRKKLHEVLALPREWLKLPDHFTLDGARTLQEQIPSFFEQGAYLNAEKLSASLIQGCRASGNQRLPAMRPILARACYTRGLATATLTDRPQQALPLFGQVGQVATELKERKGVILALTYQGEMYRRLGERSRQRGHHDKAGDYYTRARHLLEEAREQAGSGPWAARDARVVGNCQQLLARLYLAGGEQKRAFATLQLAEELAGAAASQDEEDWYVPFCLCSVRVDLAKSQMLLRRFDESLATLTEVRQLLVGAPLRWAIPVTLAEGESLLRLARMYPDQQRYEEGKKALLQGYELAHRHHHRHQQQRVHRLLTRWSKSDGLRMEYTYQLQEGVRHIDEAGGER